ncbi:hypothetical protein GCM10010210_08190 [Pseudonocardia hydrocarbonoxydans]|uniref:Uncharacterized protein n=1 Tax=Pseudonocardia hydrocarbonoxydans TaxID=76726 RepID=A0A4Y3WLU8_9PSEU|nr:hypothetical protein PHY01_22100 [Pseudonocardia hydrocarbonoxydans]
MVTDMILSSGWVRLRFSISVEISIGGAVGHGIRPSGRISPVSLGVPGQVAATRSDRCSGSICRAHPTVQLSARQAEVRGIGAGQPGPARIGGTLTTDGTSP